MAVASTPENQVVAEVPGVNPALPFIPIPTKLRVAVTQAEPGWLDIQASVNKTCSLIAEAAQQGAQILAFPECWINGYPAWIWARPVDMALATDYIKNSLRVDSPEMRQICQASAQYGLVVVLGFSERSGDSLYILQAPTHMERTVFGDASGEMFNGVVDTSAGRVGALSCWEHVQPLLKYHMYIQREQIHVAAWPPLYAHQGPELWSMSSEGARALARTYAIEAQAFLLHATAVITDKGITRMDTSGSIIMSKPGGGTSAIFGPDGVQLTEDLGETIEGLLVADIDLDDILKTKSFVDLCGHYSRPDLL